MRFPSLSVALLTSLLCFLAPANASDTKPLPTANVSTKIDWEADYEPGSLLAIIDHIEGIDHLVRIACVAVDPTSKPDGDPFGEKAGLEKEQMMVKYDIRSWKNGRWEKSLPSLVALLPRKKHRFHAVYTSSESLESIFFYTDGQSPDQGVRIEFGGKQGSMLRELEAGN